MGVGIISSWIILCVVVGVVAQSIGRGFGSYFLLSLFLSPIIGFIVLGIKGKVTQDEILDNNPHIFYCKYCNATFSGDSDSKDKNCPECNNRIDETTILRKDWRNYSKEQKEQMKLAMAQGQYMRYSSVVSIQTPITNGADELKKYKELLDIGAISQEEYNAKKKQILNL